MIRSILSLSPSSCIRNLASHTVWRPHHSCPSGIRSILPLPSLISIRITVRNKHSATQVKRLFNKHPARQRVLNRFKQQEQLLAEDVVVAVEEAMPAIPIPTTPTFPQVFQPTFLPNGWSAPPREEFNLPNYPFQVARTINKPKNSVGFLPVYTDFR